MKRNNLIILLAASLMAACDGATSTTDLSGVEGVWGLEAFQLDNGSVQDVPDAQTFTLGFEAAGSVHAQVDCNSCSGSYEVDGNSIKLGLLACTRVACPAGSLDHQFHTALGSAAAFMRAGSELSIRYAGGTMSFQLR
ncbi:MAG: META domain-containing protein [Vicinamibacteria bacterium]